MNVDEVGDILEHQGLTDEEIDDFFEHHGVKGMRWGQRRARNRELNRASRKEDRAKHQTDVEKAREFFKSGDAKAEWKQAKADFKKNKGEIGSREARKILNKTRDQQIEKYSKSQEAKNGKEVALVVLGVVGASILGAALGSH